MESRDIPCPDDTALDETLHRKRHAPVDDEFGGNEYGDCDEESHMSFDIVQKVNFTRLERPESGSREVKATSSLKRQR
jgi:hypothetical protein